MPTSQFFTAKIKATSVIKMSPKTWQIMMRAWKDVALLYLSKANAYCSFAFKRHWFKGMGSRKRSQYLF